MFLLSICAGLCLLTAAAPSAAVQPQSGRPQAQALDEIVVLGRRAGRRDGTLGAGAVTERMSPSSRSIEADLLQAVGATRLVDALELVSGVSQQNNRGGVMDNFAIRGFLGTPDGGAEYYVDGFLANRGMAPMVKAQWASVEELRRSLPMVAKALSQIIAERRRQGVALFRKFAETQDGARHG